MREKLRGLAKRFLPPTLAREVEAPLRKGKADDFVDCWKQADDILCESSRRFSDDYSSSWAALMIRRARIAYLSTLIKPAGEYCFDDAYQLLEDARANAYIGNGDEDLEVMSEVRLRTAEALLLHADWERIQHSDSEEPRYQKVKSKLERARVVLEQARAALSRRPPNLRGWALWKRLQADLNWAVGDYDPT